MSGLSGYEPNVEAIAGMSPDLVITDVFVLERVSTVWERGWRARLVAAALFPEIAYDTFIQVVFAKSLIDFLLRRDADWNYVPRGA